MTSPTEVGMEYEQITAHQLEIGDEILPWDGEVEVTGTWTITGKRITTGYQLQKHLVLEVYNSATPDLRTTMEYYGPNFDQPVRIRPRKVAA
jgi:hypothetical protein